MTTTAFTPIASLAGGALIGLAAVMLMALTGRIAGVSGIAVRLFAPYADHEFAGRLAFVAGLIAAPVMVLVATGRLPVQTIQPGAGMLGLADLRSGIAAVRHVRSGEGPQLSRSRRYRFGDLGSQPGPRDGRRNCGDLFRLPLGAGAIPAAVRGRRFICRPSRSWISGSSQVRPSLAWAGVWRDSAPGPH
jgi:hypothetical protein